MATDPDLPPDPDRERLEALVAFSRKRIDRAKAKVEEATSQHAAALDQLEADEQTLAQYLIDNPPAQPDLF